MRTQFGWHILEVLDEVLGDHRQALLGPDDGLEFVDYWHDVDLDGYGQAGLNQPLTPGNWAGPLGGWYGTSAYFSFDGGTLEYTGPTVGGINRAFQIEAGGATIDGRINVGRTEVQIPEGSLGYGGAIPDMTHIGEPGDVFLNFYEVNLLDDEESFWPDGLVKKLAYPYLQFAGIG